VGLKWFNICGFENQKLLSKAEKVQVSDTTMMNKERMPVTKK